jgi:methylmalonyl-CoA mutase cobalamin-binding domain/chain
MNQKCDIYLFAESVMAAAVQEDVHFVGLSFLADDHLEHCIITTSLLRDRGLAIPVIVGGVIPRQDIGALK